MDVTSFWLKVTTVYNTPTAVFSWQAVTEIHKSPLCSISLKQLSRNSGTLLLSLVQISSSDAPNIGSVASTQLRRHSQCIATCNTHTHTHTTPHTIHSTNTNERILNRCRTARGDIRGRAGNGSMGHGSLWVTHSLLWYVGSFISSSMTVRAIYSFVFCFRIKMMSQAISRGHKMAAVRSSGLKPRRPERHPTRDPVTAWHGRANCSDRFAKTQKNE